METYAQAGTRIRATLSVCGWTIADDGRKVPHATSPDGNVRLWFKSQAVYYTHRIHKMGEARSLHLEIRDLSAVELTAQAIRFIAFDNNAAV